MNRKFSLAVVAGTFLFVLQTAWSADSGFLTDYSKLEVREGRDLIARVYNKPDVMDELAKYNAIMIDQPEVLMAADSKYAGAKPDHLKTLSDTLRQAMIDRMAAGGYNTVTTPGPDVIYMRWAISDLYLKKKKRGLLAYTPVGMVVHTTAQMAIKDLWKKINIVQLNLEVEFLDSQTGDVLAAMVMERGHRKAKGQKQELVSWEELDAVMRAFGERVRCILDNANLDEPDRVDCSRISVEATTT
jgi:hypothetical protein